jgi:superfamily II DNA or RNA helicase
VAESARLIRKGVATLVLVRHISHGVAISERLTELGVPFLSGKDDSTHRNQVLRDLRAGSLPGLVATTIADEGLDVKPLGGLVLLGGGKSSTRALQRIGRVLRPHPGKDHAQVIDFTDNAKFLYDHSLARQRIYETEDEFIVMDV